MPIIRKELAGLGIFLIAASILFVGCNDKGVEPAAVAENAVFYFQDEQRHIFYSYDPQAGKLDSIDIAGGLTIGPVSSDGQSLYVNTGSGVDELVLSTGHRRHVWPSSAEVEQSPDGSLLAVQDGHIHFVRHDGLKLVYEDTLSIYYGVFSDDSRSFYGLHYEYWRGRTIVYRITLKPQITVKRQLDYEGSLWQVLPSPDERRLYLHGEDRNGDVLIVHDTGSGAPIMDTIIRPGAGRIALSHDGRLLAVTNPGSWPAIIGTPLPPYTVTVFDAVSLSRIADIETGGLFPGDSIAKKFLFREVAFSAESGWLLALDAIGWNFIAIDISTNKIERLGRLKDRVLSGLCVQKCLTVHSHRR